MRIISIYCRDGTACNNGMVDVEIPSETPDHIADQMVPEDGEDSMYLSHTQLKEYGMLDELRGDLDEEGGYELTPMGDMVCPLCGRDGD